MNLRHVASDPDPAGLQPLPGGRGVAPERYETRFATHQSARPVSDSRAAPPDSPWNTTWPPEARHGGIRSWITFSSPALFAIDAVPFVHRILSGSVYASPALFTLLTVSLPFGRSAAGATLDTGGWLALTRRGLAPRKIRQASLGTITIYNRCGHLPLILEHGRAWCDGARCNHAAPLRSTGLLTPTAQWTPTRSSSLARCSY